MHRGHAKCIPGVPSVGLSSHGGFTCNQTHLTPIRTHSGVNLTALYRFVAVSFRRLGYWHARSVCVCGGFFVIQTVRRGALCGNSLFSLGTVKPTAGTAKRRGHLFVDFLCVCGIYQKPLQPALSACKCKCIHAVVGGCQIFFTSLSPPGGFLVAWPMAFSFLCGVYAFLSCLWQTEIMAPVTLMLRMDGTMRGGRVLNSHSKVLPMHFVGGFGGGW